LGILLDEIDERKDFARGIETGQSFLLGVAVCAYELSHAWIHRELPAKVLFPWILISLVGSFERVGFAYELPLSRRDELYPARHAEGMEDGVDGVLLRGNCSVVFAVKRLRECSY
jgi:hypothetical protein